MKNFRNLFFIFSFLFHSTCYRSIRIAEKILCFSSSILGTIRTQSRRNETLPGEGMATDDVDHGATAHAGLIVSVGQIVRMLNGQKAHQAVTHPCQLHTSMSLLVLSRTAPLTILLPVMIPMTRFQICHGMLKHDQLHIQEGQI